MKIPHFRIIVSIFLIIVVFSCQDSQESLFHNHAGQNETTSKLLLSDDVPDYILDDLKARNRNMNLTLDNLKSTTNQIKIDTTVANVILDSLGNIITTFNVLAQTENTGHFYNYVIIENKQQKNSEHFLLEYRLNYDWIENKDKELEGVVYKHKVEGSNVVKSITKSGMCIQTTVYLWEDCGCDGHHWTSENCSCGGPKVMQTTVTVCPGGASSGGTGTGGGDTNTGTGNGDTYTGNPITNIGAISNLEIASDLNSVLGLNYEQFTYLLGLPQKELIIINNFVGENDNSTGHNLAIQAINDLMSYSSVNYPGKEDGLPFEWWLDESFLDTQDNILQQIWREWKKLTKKEKSLTKIFPDKALKIRKNKEAAFTKTRAIYGDVLEQLNGKPDAYRHAFFNAINTRDVGAEVTLLFSNAHETEVPVRWNLEKEMDLYNNVIGIAIGDEATSNTTDSNISNEVLQALANGELRYLWPIDYSLYNTDRATYNFTHGITSSTQIVPTN